MPCDVEHHQFFLEVMSQKWRNNFKGQNIRTTDPNKRNNGQPLYLEEQRQKNFVGSFHITAQRGKTCCSVTVRHSSPEPGLIMQINLVGSATDSRFKLIQNHGSIPEWSRFKRVAGQSFACFLFASRSQSRTWSFKCSWGWKCGHVYTTPQRRAQGPLLQHSSVPPQKGRIN